MVNSPGARVVTGQVIAETVPVPENAVSAMAMPWMVTLPVLVTLKL